MKTLEQLAREAGMERDGDGWFTPSGDPAGEYDVSTESLARFRAACRAEALEEAAPIFALAAAWKADTLRKSREELGTGRKAARRQEPDRREDRGLCPEDGLSSHAQGTGSRSSDRP